MIAREAGSAGFDARAGHCAGPDVESGDPGL
jgi:hypothetical protein